MIARLLILLSLLALPAEARLLRVPYEGVRPTGMGNAFLAIADDQNALWYNPAALAKNKKWRFNLMDFTLGFDSLTTLDQMRALIFENDSSSLVSDDITFLRMGFKPTLFGPNFGLGIYTNSQGFFEIRNLDLPEVDVYAFSDIALIAGLGVPISPYFSVGLSVRGVYRAGLDATITTVDLLSQLGGISQDAFMSAIFDRLKELSGAGYGLGVNFSAQLDIPTGKGGPKVGAAFSIEDFGNTSFTALGASRAPEAINQSVNFGSSVSYKAGKNDEVNFAFDLRHMFEGVSLGQMSSLGIEWRHKVFSLRAGLYQLYPTFGFSIEVLPHTKIHASSYAVEIGDDASPYSHRWWLVQAVIGFNPF